MESQTSIIVYYQLINQAIKLSPIEVHNDCWSYKFKFSEWIGTYYSLTDLKQLICSPKFNPKTLFHLHLKDVYLKIIFFIQSPEIYQKLVQSFLLVLKLLYKKFPILHEDELSSFQEKEHMFNILYLYRFEFLTSLDHHRDYFLFPLKQGYERLNHIIYDFFHDKISYKKCLTLTLSLTSFYLKKLDLMLTHNKIIQSFYYFIIHSLQNTSTIFLLNVNEIKNTEFKRIYDLGDIVPDEDEDEEKYFYFIDNVHRFSMNCRCGLIKERDVRLAPASLYIIYSNKINKQIINYINSRRHHHLIE